MHALTILLIGLAPENENFPIQHKIYDELKDDYGIEFLSSDKFAQVLNPGFPKHITMQHNTTESPELPGAA